MIVLMPRLFLVGRRLVSHAVKHREACNPFWFSLAGECMLCGYADPEANWWRPK